jgi:WD40 repeat protein
VTCSHDLSVHLWRHYGDRWAFSYIDIAKSFDQSLSFQRKQCDRSTREMKLTAVCAYPRSNNLIVGDNKGYIRVFQLVNENAHLISTHKLQRTSDAKMEAGLGLTPGNPQGTGLTQPRTGPTDTIKEIYITNNEQVAVVTYESGSVTLYDTKNGFALLGDAVESDF